MPGHPGRRVLGPGNSLSAGVEAAGASGERVTSHSQEPSSGGDITEHP